MEAPQPFKKWVPVTASIGFVAFLVNLFMFTDVAQVGLVIAGTNLSVYTLAFLAVVVGSFFDTLAWKNLLSYLGERVGFWRLFELTWTGQFLDSLVPGGVAGDVSKIYLLSKDDGVHGAKVTAAIVTKDALEMLISVGFLAVGAVLLFSFYSANAVLAAAIGMTFLFLLIPLSLIMVLSFSDRATTKLVNVLYRVFSKVKGEQAGKTMRGKLEAQLREFHDGVTSIRHNPRKMAKPLLYISVGGLLNVATLLFVFYSLGVFIGFDKVYVVNIIVNNLQVQGVMLAGFSDVVCSNIYGVLGITRELSMASSILSDFAGFWFRLIISFAYFELIAANKCVPFFCRKCGGWRSWKSMRDKTCE